MKKFKSASKVKASGFARSAGKIPAMKSNASTSRAQTVSQAQSVAILAGKRAGQKAIVASKQVIPIPNRLPPPDVRNVLPEATQGALKGAGMMTDARVR